MTHIKLGAVVDVGGLQMLPRLSVTSAHSQLCSSKFQKSSLITHCQGAERTSRLSDVVLDVFTNRLNY